MGKQSLDNRRLAYRLVAGLIAVFVLIALTRFVLLRSQIWYARAALRARDAETALSWLDAAASLGTKSGEIAFLRARAHRRLRHPKEVRRELMRAAELGYAIEVLQREETLMLAQSGQLAPGAPEAVELMTHPGADALEIYETLVLGYIESFQTTPAILLLDGWEADHPNDPLPRYFRGLIHVNSKAWREAADAFLEALELGSSQPSIRRRLADALREDHRYREAMWHYERCPNGTRDADVLYGLGKCLQYLADPDGARESFLSLLELTPDHFDGLVALGQLEYSQGEYEQATSYLQRAVELNPDEFTAQHTLAWALLILGKKEQARMHFEQAVATRYAMHRAEKLLRAIERDPSNVGCRYELGILFLTHNRLSDGVSWLQSVLQLEPGHRLAHLALADHYSKRGEEEVANHHLRAATP